MRRPLRWSAGVALLLVAVLAVAAGVVTWTVRRSLPEYDGSVQLAGLTGSVKVLRDDLGVPQVYADTAEDLFGAQGSARSPSMRMVVDLSDLDADQVQVWRAERLALLRSSPEAVRAAARHTPTVQPGTP